MRRFIERFLYWIWNKEMELRLHSNPANLFIWKMHKCTTYDKAFERGGYWEVLREHDRYINEIDKYIQEVKNEHTNQ